MKPIAFDDRNGLSASEAAILAVIANPALRAIRDRRGIAVAQLLQAGILPNPQVSYDFEAPVGGDTQGTVTALGLRLGWDIASLVSRGARTDAARAHAASVDLEVAWQEWQVAETARLHTYRLAIARRRLASARQAATALERSWQAMRHAVARGVKTLVDLAPVAARRREAEAVVVQAQAEVEQERLALNRTLGLPAGTVLALEDSVRSPSLQLPPVATLAAGIEDRRLDLVALERGYQSQDARVRAAIRSQFPRIALGFSASRDPERVETVGFGISIAPPVLDRNQGRIAIARATRKQLFDDYVARVFAARADVARLVSQVQSTRARLARMDGALAAIRKLAEGYRNAADNGRLAVFRYYEELSVLDSKQLQRIDLEQRVVDLGIALELASGRYGLVGHASAPPGGPQAHERRALR